MKKLLIALLFIAPLLASAKEPTSSNYQSPDESQLIEHRHYVNKVGKEVHSPSHTKNDAMPAGATAKCRDGSYSFSQNHRGTCSHHGGVAQWF